MEYEYIYAGAALLLILFAFTFRDGLTDIVYLALKNAKLVLFVFFCMMIGLLAGLYETSSSPSSLGDYAGFLGRTGESRTAETIRECKIFVAARLEHRRDYEEPDPPLGDVVKIGAKSFWDTCAHVFGMNYWKYDLSINGENGGEKLCRAYRESDYRSDYVSGWCATVFMPAPKRGA